MTEPVENPTPTVPTPPVPVTTATRRARTRWFPIAAVALAALLLTASVLFLLGAHADRDDAQHARRAAAAELRIVRTGEEDARTALSGTRSGIERGMTMVDALTVPFDELVRLADREVEIATDARDAGANGSDARVDEYNDLVSRNNEVVDQFNDRLTELDEQIRATVPDDAKSF